MKKCSFLFALLICSAVLFSPFRDNNVNACGTHVPAAGGSVKKCKMLKMQVEYAEDPDAFFGLFMNPFQH